MGRTLLIAAIALAAGSCAQPGEPPKPAEAGAAHTALSCAACHGAGLEVTRATARVEDRTCTAAGCHADGGPIQVTLDKVTFRHRQHGTGKSITSSCAGCHMHVGDVRDKVLTADADACTLCHADQLGSGRGDSCRMCHRDPTQSPLTSQGVPIPHSSLSTLETSCLRCHYDVAAPRMVVSTARCAGCHTSAEVTQGIGKDLHPLHTGIGCVSCHEAASHRVLAMSSAVVLVCADCHGEAHGTRLAALGNPSAMCNDCHGTEHRAQQRLVLGEVPGMPAEPALKFALGLTCRSCHVPPSTASGGVTPVTSRPLRGQPSACVACHRPEYARIVGWWVEGTKARDEAVLAYVQRARRELGSGASATTASALDSARSALEIVARGGGEHNIELSDAIFRASVRRVQAAYRAAGRAAPAPPALGNVPHVGFCSYCHYSTREPWDFARMSAEFHRFALDPARIGAAEASAH